jgi:hypothetical protein
VRARVVAVLTVVADRAAAGAIGNTLTGGDAPSLIVT